LIVHFRYKHHKKNWTSYLAYLLVLGGIVAQMPPAHLAAQFMFTAPVFM
jgi:hypothetical protein